MDAAAAAASAEHSGGSSPTRHQMLAYLAELRAKVAAAEAGGGGDTPAAATAAAPPDEAAATPHHNSLLSLVVSDSEDDSEEEPDDAAANEAAGRPSATRQQPTSLSLFTPQQQLRPCSNETAGRPSATSHHSTSLVSLFSPQQLRPMQRSVTYSNGDTYVGGMLGDQRHGEGVHTTADGSIVYEGAWRFDVRHGHGTFRAASGLVYTGSWADDRAAGQGSATYPDGSRYEGDFEGDVRSGWGVLETADGQRYEGEWRDDQPHGEGQWVFAGGAGYFRGEYRQGQRHHGQLVTLDPASGRPVQTYSGSFKDGQRHGPDGVCVEEGAWEYRGGFKADVRCGQGTCRYVDGRVYAGAWEADAQHGVGTLRLPDDSELSGDWRGGQMHGTGRVRHASGESFVGEWQAGKPHGRGRWASAPKPVPGSSSGAERREVYTGTFAYGHREGQGVAEYADGGRYEGGWRAGKRHGHGLMVFADGCVFRGAWEDDAWLQSAAEPALCVLRGPGLTSLAAGSTAVFSIQARDELSNARLTGGDTFRVLLAPAAAASADDAGPSPADAAAPRVDSTLASPGSAAQAQPTESALGAPSIVVTAVAEGDVQDHGDGSYTASYSHTQAGRYLLHVTNGDGEHVADSPYRVAVLPGPPSARHSTVTGAGRRRAVAGCVATFEVVARDAHGNALHTSTTPAGDAAAGQGLGAVPLELAASLVGSNALPAASVEIACTQPGVCVCSYRAPSTPGSYRLEVVTAADGCHVGGSPFAVSVVVADTTTASASAAAASSDTASGQQQQHTGVVDRLAWWAGVAREAFAAVDGSLEGFVDEPAVLPGTASSVAASHLPAGLSDAEVAMLQANPSLPVVERLEDLHLLSKLQQERKAAEVAAAASKTVRQQQMRTRQQEPASAAPQQRDDGKEAPAGEEVFDGNDDDGVLQADSVFHEADCNDVA